RAVRKLGWTHVPVVVRRDLAEAGAAACEQYFINDNLLRRHLTGLGKARCIHRLLELVGSRGGELKERIAERMGLSVRSVNRYLPALKAPPAVQQAFDAGHVSLVEAGKAALLPEWVQREVAGRIESGEPARDVVREAVGRNRLRSLNANRVLS